VELCDGLAAHRRDLLADQALADVDERRVCAPQAQRVTYVSRAQRWCRVVLVVVQSGTEWCCCAPGKRSMSERRTVGGLSVPFIRSFMDPVALESASSVAYAAALPSCV